MSGENEFSDFSRTLKTLTTNDKYIINTLSVMAMNARENATLSKEIAKLAMSQIFKVVPQLKLTNFYVVDSIIKNVGSPYKEMFADKVLDAFIHTFQANKDHKIRIKLYNLRLTWKEYFSPDLMNQLDEEVKKYDPAWPLVQKFNQKYKNSDKKSESNNNNDNNTNNNSAKSSPDSTTPTVNRDPRIFKIIKPEKEIDRKRPNKDQDDEELFTIDRDGEEHIKNLISKKPKIETKINNNIIKNKDSSPTDSLFGAQDLDLRVLSNDKIKTDDDSEIRNTRSHNWTSEDVFKMLIKQDKFPYLSIQPPIANSPKLSIQATPLPQPREPTWKVKIDGLPQMPSIGTDPRLLARCPFYDPSRTITIDGIKHTLHLDRIQPCIFVNNELHAVRFYCPNIEVNIDNVPFEISPNGLAHIKINRRFYIACLGGPGHELIINGWPYNVRIDGNMHQISVSGYPVSVQFLVQRSIQVNVMNPIPPYICEWAVKGYFGSPQYLNIAPLNPLRNQKLQDEQSVLFRNELPALFDRRNQSTVAKPETVSVMQKPPENILPPPPIPLPAPPPPAPVATAPAMTVHDLFQKLVATGIILPNKSNELKLDITKFSLDSFKMCNDKEINELYSGHQCDLCGTRFKNKDSKEFELHLDYHFYKNTTSLTSTRKGRNYVTGSRLWVLGGSIKAVEPEYNYEQITSCEQKFKCPMFEDAEMNKCAVCMEGFEVAWDDEEEAFMLQDGQLHNDKVYHPICLEDADKQNQEQSMNEADKSQIELTNQPLAALQKVLQGKMDSVVLPDNIKSESVYKTNQSEQEFDYESAIS